MSETNSDFIIAVKVMYITVSYLILTRPADRKDSTLIPSVFSCREPRLAARKNSAVKVLPHEVAQADRFPATEPASTGRHGDCDFNAVLFNSTGVVGNTLLKRRDCAS